jgi:hypothetical protein
MNVNQFPLKQTHTVAHQIFLQVIFQSGAAHQDTQRTQRHNMP